MPTLWPYVPATARETMQFTTQIKPYRNAEQRVAGHSATLRLGFDYDKTAAEATRMEYLYRSNATGEWYVPLWHDYTLIPSGLSAGATAISVETNADYFDGGTAAIIQDDQTAEIVTISTVGSGVINLSGGGVAAAYTGAVNVCPARTAIMSAPLGRNSSRIGPERLSADFLVTDGQDQAANPFGQVAGFDVVTDVPSISTPYEGNIAQEIAITESGFGAYFINAIETYARRALAVEFTSSGAVDRWRLRQWLYAARGRDRAFFMPSYKADMILTAPIGSADTTITVQEFAPDDTALVGAVIYIQGAGNYAREITAASTAGGVHTLTIAALGTAEASPTISLAPLVRFATDRFEIEHRRIAEGFRTRFRAPTIEVAA